MRKMADDKRPRIKTDRNLHYETRRLLEWLGLTQEREDGQYLVWRLDIPGGMPYPEPKFLPKGW